MHPRLFRRNVQESRENMTTPDSQKEFPARWVETGLLALFPSTGNVWLQQWDTETGKLANEILISEVAFTRILETLETERQARAYKKAIGP